MSLGNPSLPRLQPLDICAKTVTQYSYVIYLPKQYHTVATSYVFNSKSNKIDNASDGSRGTLESEKIMCNDKTSFCQNK